MLTTVGCATTDLPPVSDHLRQYEVADPALPEPIHEAPPQVAGTCTFAGSEAVAMTPEQFDQLAAFVDASIANREALHAVISAYAGTTRELRTVVQLGAGAEALADHYRGLYADEVTRQDRQAALLTGGLAAALLMALGIAL